MTYIFDFDGTLVDSMPVFSRHMQNMFEKNHLPVSPDFVKIITPLGYAGTYEYAKTLGLQITKEEFIAEVTEAMTYEYHHTIPAKKYVKEALLRLKADGHSLNVLTASPHAVLDVCLKRVELYELFDQIWSCDDFGRTKAEPEIYTEAAQRLGTNVEDCIFADDNVGAVSTAKKAGMVTVGVFDESSKELVEEMKLASDRYIQDFREL